MIERYEQWEKDDNAHFIVLKVCKEISMVLSLSTFCTISTRPPDGKYFSFFMVHQALDNS